MRFYPHGRWQKRLWWAALFVLAVVGFWVYLIATRSPINVRTMVKLNEDLERRDMDRAEVEERLGGPATASRPLVPPRRTGELVPFESLEEIIPGTQTFFAGMPVPPPKLGELSGNAFEMTLPFREGRTIVEVATWDGLEGRVLVSFDDEGRVAGARFLERVSWRSKLYQWMPWLSSDLTKATGKS